MIAAVDANENGTIEFPEWLVLMKYKVMEKEDEDDLRERFRAFDLDGSGFIDAKEIRQVMAAMGETLSDEEVDEMIREADKDGDGQASFLCLFNNPPVQTWLC